MITVIYATSARTLRYPVRSKERRSFASIGIRKACPQSLRQDGPHRKLRDFADLRVVQTAPGGAQMIDPRAGITVALGRAHLPSGANIAFHEADGYLFVGVETGALVLTNEHDVMPLDRLDVDGLSRLP